MNDFYPLVLDAFRYNGKNVGAGPLYGLPKDFTTFVTYVNLDLFEKAGLQVPYAGWTWDQYEADMKKIAALSEPGAAPGDRYYGGVINGWPAVLQNVVWGYGGEFFGNDGRDFQDVRLGDPDAQAALQMIHRTRFEDKSVYNATGIAKEGGQLFYDGKIGCICPLGRWMTPRYRSIKNFRWDVVPLPHQKRDVSSIATVAWTMSATTKHPKEAFELMKYLCGPEGQIKASRLGLAIPSLKSVAESDAFVDGQDPKHTSLFLDAIAHSRLAQNPQEREFNQYLEQESGKALQLGQESTAQMAANVKTHWLRELDSPLRRQASSPMPWNQILLITSGLLALFAALLWWRARQQNMGALDRAQERVGWMFILPWLIGFATLTLGPMIFSLLLSFTKWSAITPLNTASYVGTANYQHLFAYDREAFVQSLWVTVYYVVLMVPLGQIASLAVALLMNAKVRGIALYRTAFFIPSIITGVAMATLWFKIFNNDYGLLNSTLRPVLGWLGLKPPDWFGLDAKVFAIPGFVIMGLWSVGGGMIVYLAGLKSIPTSYYEAARIDGASPLRQFWNVTLPMLSPLLFFNFIMAIIGSFQVFTPAYVMTGPGPDNSTLFYVLNLFNQAFKYHNMGYSSAMAWVLFIFVLVLTLLAFRVSRKWVYYEGLKG